MSNLSKLKIDDIISNYLVNNLIFFKYISPNLITLSGIILNFYIYHLAVNKNSNLFILGICLAYRWLVDCLDGAVARKYHKTSKLGHYLDTLSDFIALFLACYVIQKNIFNLSLTFCLIVYSIFLIIFNYYFNFINTHNQMKNKDNNQTFINILIGFLVNNSLITYIFTYILYIIVRIKKI
jgi:phosphatidylglycerophosphate synthase